MNESHPLVLRVMHLSRPSLATTAPTAAQENLSGIGKVLDGDDPEFLKKSVLTDALVLPSAMGKVYLGEKFSCILHVTNEGRDKVTNVTLKAEMQMGAQRENMLPDLKSFDALSTGDGIQAPVDHDIQSLSPRILVCSVYYTTPSGDRRSFRKFFQFEVNEPFEVRPAQHTIKNDIVVQLQLTNLMTQAVHLQSVTFLPNPSLKCTDINSRSYESAGKQRSLFLDHPSIQPKDVRMFLFQLSPKKGLSQSDYRRLLDLGRFEIVWRHSMGAAGRLQTNTITRKQAPPTSLEARTTTKPAVVCVGKRFAVTVEVHNYSGSAIEAGLLIDQTKSMSNGLVANDCMKRMLGVIEPGESKCTELEFVATRSGFLQCSSVHLFDKTNNVLTAIQNLFETVASHDSSDDTSKTDIEETSSKRQIK